MSAEVKTTYTGEIKAFLSGIKEKKCCKASNEYGKRFVAENLFVELARAEKQKSSVMYIDNYQRKVFVKARSKIHTDLIICGKIFFDRFMHILGTNFKK